MLFPLPDPLRASLARSSRRRRTRLRRLTGVVVLAAAAVALAPLTGLNVGAVADERSDAVDQQKEAEQRKAEVTSSLEGVSADLGQAYLDLQSAQSELATAQADLETAEGVLAQKQREQQTATDRLNVAQTDLDALTSQAEQSQSVADENNDELASLVVSTYQGDTTLTSWTYVLDSDSVEDLSQRTSTMAIASGVQESVLAAAEAERALDANRQARQDAATTRVAELKTQADAAAAEAQTAADDAQAKRDSVAARTAEQETAAANLESKKAGLEEEQAQAEADAAAAAAEIARIDEENRAAAAAAGTPVAPAGATDTASMGTGSVGHPIAGPLVVTSPFGWRMHPVLGYRKLHAGVDLAASTGTPQLAAVSGTVTSTADYGGTACGKSVTINGGVIDGQSIQVRYCHLSVQQVSLGQSVSRGQPIGLTGATGGVTGPHVHFEVYVNGSPVDPMSLPGF